MGTILGMTNIDYCHRPTHEIKHLCMHRSLQDLNFITCVQSIHVRMTLMGLGICSAAVALLWS